MGIERDVSIRGCLGQQGAFLQVIGGLEVVWLSLGLLLYCPDGIGRGYAGDKISQAGRGRCCWRYFGRECGRDCRRCYGLGCGGMSICWDWLDLDQLSLVVPWLVVPGQSAKSSGASSVVGWSLESSGICVRWYNGCGHQMHSMTVPGLGTC